MTGDSNVASALLLLLIMAICLHEGVQCLLDESLVKLSREDSKSLADVTLSQRPNVDSASLPWSSPLDVEGGCSSFSGMLLHYSCRERDKSPTTPTLFLWPCNLTSLAGCGLALYGFAVCKLQFAAETHWFRWEELFFLNKTNSGNNGPLMSNYCKLFTLLHPDLSLSLDWVNIIFSCVWFELKQAQSASWTLTLPFIATVVVSKAI